MVKLRRSASLILRSVALPSLGCTTRPPSLSATAATSLLSLLKLRLRNAAAPDVGSGGRALLGVVMLALGLTMSRELRSELLPVLFMLNAFFMDLKLLLMLFLRAFVPLIGF
jgi:hypothetical protein